MMVTHNKRTEWFSMLSRLLRITSLSICLSSIAADQTLLAQESVSSTEEQLRRKIHWIDSLGERGEFDSALTLTRSVLKEARSYWGENDTTVATLINFLGNIHFAQQSYVTAESLLVMSLEMREQLLSSSHIDIVQDLEDLMQLYLSLRRYSEAEALSARALAIRESSLGPNHIDLTDNLYWLAVCYARQNRHTDAVPLMERSLAIVEKAYGPEHEWVVSGLHDLGTLYSRSYRYEEALPVRLRELSTAEKVYGPDHPEVENALNCLAVLYWDLWRYDKAEPLYKRALALSEATLGQEDIEPSTIRHNLAILYTEQGNFAEAKTLFEREIESNESTLDPDHPALANIRMSYARMLQGQKNWKEAESVMKLSLMAFEKSVGAGHWLGGLVQVAFALNELSTVYLAQERYAEARQLLDRALRINIDELGPEHPAVATTLENLAKLNVAEDKYADAAECYRRILAIREKTLGADHPQLAQTFNNLARMYGSTGKADSSLLCFERTNEIRLGFLQSVFSNASEGQKLRYIRSHPAIDHSFLSFTLKNPSAEARSAALEMVLKGKAIVIDAFSAERNTAYCSYDGRIKQTLKQHDQLGVAIAGLYLAGGGGKGPELYQTRLRHLMMSRDSLEAELSRFCAAFDADLAIRHFEVADVAAALSEGQVLWEFVKYEPYDYDKIASDGEKTGAARYLGVQLSHNGSIAMEDLGDAIVIESLINTFRQQIRRAANAIYRGLEDSAESSLSIVSTKLYDFVFDPMKKHLGSSDQILISADGELSLLPFEALFGPDGEYVIENYQVSYLSSGRDLLKYESAPKRDGGSAIVVFDPDFDSISSGTIPNYFASVLPGQIETSELVLRGATNRRNCLDLPFKRLSATQSEGNAVESLLTAHQGWSVKSYSGDLASESQLKSIVNPPRVIHLATHGYYCPNAAFSADAEGRKNPLLYSGLAFAGANRVVRGEFDYDSIQTSQQDGILTSLEASGLNLIGTELVVLSACQTGVGEVENGEGVYGLRRAFQLAGARSVIMSMFAVPDKATQTLITRFYENWLSGKSKASSLRQAALSIIRERRANGGAAHPLFWGGFVLVGDPN